MVACRRCSEYAAQNLLHLGCAGRGCGQTGKPSTGALAIQMLAHHCVVGPPSFQAGSACLPATTTYVGGSDTRPSRAGSKAVTVYKIALKSWCESPKAFHTHQDHYPQSIQLTASAGLRGLEGPQISAMVLMM